METYVSNQSRIWFLDQMHRLFGKGQHVDSAFNKTTIAEQILEYMPLQSMPYLRRWLKANGSNPELSQEILKSSLEIFADLSVVADFIDCAQVVCGNLGMGKSFIKSQVSNFFCFRLVNHG